MIERRMQAQPSQPMQTVKGIPLQPGERVVYFEQRRGGAEKIIYIVGGILMLPILVGFYLLYLAFTSDETSTEIITTHRFIWLKGRDRRIIVPHGTIARASFNHDRRGLGVTAVTVVDANRQVMVFRTNYDQGRASFVMNAAQDPAQLSRLPTVQYEP